MLGKNPRWNLEKSQKTHLDPCHCFLGLAQLITKGKALSTHIQTWQVSVFVCWLYLCTVIKQSLLRNTIMHPEKRMSAYQEVKAKKIWEIHNLHWTAVEWCLEEITILKIKMACAPYWQFLPNLICLILCFQRGLLRPNRRHCGPGDRTI